MRLLFLILLSNICFAQTKVVVPIQKTIQLNGFVTPPSVTYDTIQVNVYDSAANKGKMTGKVAPDFWNQWSIDKTNSTTSGLYSTYLLNKTGTTTGIRVKLVNGAADYSDNTAAYGATAPANSTGFPDSTFWSAHYRTSSPTLTISGLDNAKTYTIKILTSRNSATSRPQTFTIGATGVSQDAALNKSTLVTFTDISPSSGDINCVITFSASFCYVNALQIIEKTAL